MQGVRGGGGGVLNCLQCLSLCLLLTANWRSHCGGRSALDCISQTEICPENCVFVLQQQHRAGMCEI